MSKIIEKQIKSLDVKVDGLDKKFEEKFDNLDKKVNLLDKKFDLLDKKIDGVESSLVKKIDNLDNRFDNFAIAIQETFDRIEANMATKDDIKVFTDRFDVVEFRLNNHDNVLDDHLDKILVIKKHVGLT